MKPKAHRLTFVLVAVVLGAFQPSHGGVVGVTAGVGTFTRDVLEKDCGVFTNKRRLDEFGGTNLVSLGAGLQTEVGLPNGVLQGPANIWWHAIVDCWDAGLLPFGSGPVEIRLSSSGGNSFLDCHVVTGTYQITGYTATITGETDCTLTDFITQTQPHVLIDLTVVYAATGALSDPTMVSGGSYSGEVVVAGTHAGSS